MEKPTNDLLANNVCAYNLNSLDHEVEILKSVRQRGLLKHDFVSDSRLSSTKE